MNDRGESYGESFALSLRWAGDDTNAKGDVESSQGILRAFGLSPAQELVIPQNKRLQGQTGSAILDTFRAANSSPQKTILFIHYAGHGIVSDGGLCAVSH